MPQSSVQPIVKQIHDSFQNALAGLPAYAQILPFFETLFEMQEAAVSDTHPQTPSIDSRRLQLTLQGKTPLVDRQALTFDQPAAVHLLSLICDAARMANPKLAAAAKVIKDFINDDEPAVKRGLLSYMADDRGALQRLGRHLDIETDILAFFFYHSIWPSLARHERVLTEQHAVNGHWKQGVCPVCGSRPSLSFLSENGGRFMSCRFCRHAWPVDRIFCPFCSNRNAETMEYFFCDQEMAYRVDTCDQCKHYIKTIDTRSLGRHFYAPLEDLVTAHLDIQARGLGYRGGVADGPDTWDESSPP